MIRNVQIAFYKCSSECTCISIKVLAESGLHYGTLLHDYKLYSLDLAGRNILVAYMENFSLKTGSFWPLTIFVFSLLCFWGSGRR